MAYKLLVFDFDGTLADSMPFFLEVFDTLAERHGFRRLDPANHAAWRSCDARRLLRHVGLPLWKTVRVAADFRAMMAAHIGRIALFEGIEQALHALAAQGYTLALLSSNSLANVRAVLGERTAALFSHIECGAGLFGKRRKLRRLLAASGVARHDALCIGDELRDIEAAHGEGIDFGAVSWGFTLPEALRAQRPRMLFESVAELAQLGARPA